MLEEIFYFVEEESNTNEFILCRVSSFLAVVNDEDNIR